jgi:outer membrane receptor for ferrienterochelin and colicin
MLQKFNVLVFAMVMATTVSFAQTGSIAGVITDEKTGETIVGANVAIQGTQIGAATDINGKFIIQNVKPGTYTLAVSFVTYKTHIIPDVVVEANKVITVTVTLVEDAQELNEVVVTGTRQVDTDFSVVAAIRESKLVVSGISSEQISKSQDRDAAQVVRRVPGVTLQDNRFVVVRGLASRYSNVILNGVLAPSTEADSRAFSFDIIPSSSLDRMLVYKSGAAELPGDFAGAVIQVSTKTAVESNFTNFSLSTGYRQGTTFTTQQSQQRASTEWLGFDNGMRDLPNGAPSDYRDLGFNVTAIEKASRAFKNTWALENINVAPDARFNIDLGRHFQIGNLDVSSVNSLSYSNTNQYNEIEFNRYFNYTDEFKSEKLFAYKDDQFSNNARIGLLSNWSIKYSPNSRIEFRNLYNRLGSTITTIREGLNTFRSSEYRNYSLRYIERSIYSGQLEGKHTLRNGNSTLTWLTGFTSAQRNEPDWKRLVTSRPLGASDETPFVVSVPSSTSPSNAARFYQELTEYNLTNRLDYEHKLVREDGKEPVELKTGYWFEYKDRSFSARQIGHIARDGFDPAIAALPYDQIFDPSNVAYTGGHIISENTNVTDSYSATNMLVAGYVSANIPLSKKIRIVPGVRVEYNHQKLETAPGVGAKQVDNPITSILPFLNMSYNLNESSLVRLAYSKTVNRPEFREIAPFSFYDFDNQADILGNQDLTIADIHNVDLRWEYYPTPGELISAGVFYKFFDNPIETNIDNGADNAVFLYNNADKAQNYGVEVELRKSLAYSSSSRFLNNTFIVFNAAYIYSVINLKDDGTLMEKDSRPMQGQSPYIINAAVFYQDDETGLQANLQYNVFGKRIAFVGIPGTPTWWEMPRHSLDFTFSKRIGLRTDLRFGISDILNAKMLIREDANLDNDVRDADTNRVVRSTRNGQYFTMGVAFKF